MKHHAGLIGLLLIGVASFAYAMFQGGFVSWFLLYAIIPFLIFALIIYFYPVRKMTVERELTSGELTRGQTLEVTLHITRNDWWPLYYMKVRDYPPFKDYEPKQRIVFVGFRRSITLTYAIEKLPRGIYIFDDVELELVDLLGWLRKSWIVSSPHQITVYPRVTDLFYTPIASNYDQGAARARFQAHKENSVATGVREYQPGDRVSWIDWKSFAKSQTLRTKDFEDRQAQDTLLYLDRTEGQSFDDAIDFTLSVVHAMEKSDSTGAFIIPGSKGMMLTTVQHQGHVERAKRELATTEAIEAQAMRRLISEDKRLGTFKGIICITAYLEKTRIEALTHMTPNLREGICFVVKGENAPRLTSAELPVEEYAKARGWSVITVSPSQFPDAFGEVAKR